MATQSLLSSSNQYDRLSDDKFEGFGDRKEHYYRPQRSTVRRISFQCIVATLIASLSATVGFLLGKYAPELTSPSLLPTLGNDIHVWHLNTSFSGPPTEHTEQAWESVIPIGRGFVQHDITNGRVGNIAVFHQIHCVHEIRVAYYVAMTKLNASDPQNDDGHLSGFLKDLSKEDGRRHIAHCFDYLRRVLMCASDTNMEYPDENGLLTGWGVERTCRNYQQVYDWAERWRVDNRTEIQ